MLESASELSTEMHPQDIQTAEGGKPVEAGDAPAPGFAGGPGGDGKRTLACQPLPAYRAAEGSRFTHGWSAAGARSTYQTQPAKPPRHAEKMAERKSDQEATESQLGVQPSGVQ